MTRQFFAGGSYVDALPTGEFCVLFLGSHIQTHLGPIPLPPNETGPLFLRCTNVGGFKFAGQAHDSNGGYEWSERLFVAYGNGWRAFGPPVCGINPVIYDRLGILHVSDCSMGTQGFRYVEDDGTPEGKIHSGDETYGSPFGLSEWSAYGGLFGGQGHDGGGCRIYDGSVLRELESGDCRFVRVQGAGQNVAISFVKPDGAVIVIASLAELRALPKVGMVVPPPPPPPPIDPPKKEPPVSIPDLAAVFASAVNARPDLLAQYRAIAAEGNAKGWPQDVQDRHVAIRQVLVRIGAFAVFQQNHDFGLLKKEGGAHGTRPIDGVAHALQILAYKPTMQLIQVLNDTDPEWDMKDPNDTRPAEFWIQPLPEGAPPFVPPSPPPLDPPPPVSDPPESDSLAAAIFARLNLLELRMRAEFDVQRAAQEDTVRSLVAIAASLEALKARESGSPSAVKFPSYAGTIRLSGAVKLDPVVPK